MEECIFCKICDKKIPADIFFEDENVLVILDIDDAVKGHILVIQKKHHINVSDLMEDDYLHFSKVFHRIEKSVLDLVKKERSVVLKTGGLVPHFHFHIYPVDKETSWEEIKDIFDKKVKYSYKEGERNELINALRNNLFE